KSRFRHGNHTVKLDSCFWTFNRTSPSLRRAPMVLKIDLWRLRTLVRRFLSLGIGFSLKNSEPSENWPSSSFISCLSRYPVKIPGRVFYGSTGYFMKRT
ncbi:unnamed protein product, partial [Linum tenue]